MRWPLIVTLAFGIKSPAQVEAVEGYNEDGAGKNDDTSLVDRCENISPYTMRQVVQHIQLNSEDLTKLKNSIDDRFEAESRKRESQADSVDKALIDLQKKFTLLSEQRQQDKKMYEQEIEAESKKRDSEAASVDRTLIDLQKKNILLSEQREQDRLRYEAKITRLERILSDYKTEHLLDKLVNTVSFGYPKETSVYRESNTVVVGSPTHNGSCRAIIFAHSGVTKYTMTVKKGDTTAQNRAYILAGWSKRSKAFDSIGCLGGRGGWPSVGLSSRRGSIQYYPGNYESNNLPTFDLIGQSMTTKIDYAGKFFIFETSGRSYKRSFSSVNMGVESEEDRFYPAFSLMLEGEVIISNIEFETNN